MNYFIATEGRAGSTLLCQHLKQMGIGDPYPYLSGDVMKFETGTIEEMSDYVESKRKNGILGIKISWGILTKLDTEFKLKMNAHEFLNALCPNAKYIYQTRRDRVHQALSRIKHLMMDTSHIRSSGSFEKYRVKETDRLLNAPVPLDDIHERIQRNAIGYKAWEIYFNAYNIIPLEVVFEDLVSDRDTVLGNICEFLGVPLRLDMLKDKLISTHTEVNDKWYERVLGGHLKYL